MGMVYHGEKSLIGRSLIIKANRFDILSSRAEVDSQAGAEIRNFLAQAESMAAAAAVRAEITENFRGVFHSARIGNSRPALRPRGKEGKLWTS
jgi:plasmid stabilization system protein ParE